MLQGSRTEITGALGILYMVYIDKYDPDSLFDRPHRRSVFSERRGKRRQMQFLIVYYDQASSHVLCDSRGIRTDVMAIFIHSAPQTIDPKQGVSFNVYSFCKAIVCDFPLQLVNFYLRYLACRFVVLTHAAVHWFKRDNNEEDLLGELRDRVLLKEISVVCTRKWDLGFII